MQNMNETLDSQKNTPYLALMGELWSVYWENFQENWRCYNGTAQCYNETALNPEM